MWLARREDSNTIVTSHLPVTFAFSDYETTTYGTKKVRAFFTMCSTLALECLNVRRNNTMGFQGH